MTDKPDMATRMEAGENLDLAGWQALMAPLGYEVAAHARLGRACRDGSSGRWQSVPSWRSADDAERWLHGYGLFGIADQGGAGWLVTFNRRGGRTGRGESGTLGIAMWAAFVRATCAGE